MRRWTAGPVTAVLVLVVVLGLAVGCSGDGDGGGGRAGGGDAGGEVGARVPEAAAGAPTAYDRELCDLVYGWRGELAEGVERLSREGVPQEPPGRHRLAVEVVDALVAATHRFADDVAALGGPDGEVAEVVEEELRAGATAAVGELDDARVRMSELEDADFEDLVYRGAELAASLEKASSLVTAGLERLATDHGVAGPNAICGTGRLVN